MKEPNLAIVFGKGKPKDEPEDDSAESADESEDSEMSEALDAAIDDLFAAKSPEARRDAFKTAVNLCKESAY